jgi:hypothetical protein
MRCHRRLQTLLPRALPHGTDIVSRSLCDGTSGILLLLRTINAYHGTPRLRP